jgi:hypothetical protein
MQRIWKTVFESHAALDTVFGFEKTLSETFESDKKFAFEQRGQTTVKTYSKDYSEAYSKMMDGMVERRMRTRHENGGRLMVYLLGKCPARPI